MSVYSISNRKYSLQIQTTIAKQLDTSSCNTKFSTLGPVIVYYILNHVDVNNHVDAMMVIEGSLTTVVRSIIVTMIRDEIIMNQDMSGHVERLIHSYERDIGGKLPMQFGPVVTATIIIDQLTTAFEHGNIHGISVETLTAARDVSLHILSVIINETDLIIDRILDTFRNFTTITSSERTKFMELIEMILSSGDFFDESIRCIRYGLILSMYLSCQSLIPEEFKRVNEICEDGINKYGEHLVLRETFRSISMDTRLRLMREGEWSEFTDRGFTYLKGERDVLKQLDPFDILHKKPGLLSGILNPYVHISLCTIQLTNQIQNIFEIGMLRKRLLSKRQKTIEKHIRPIMDLENIISNYKPTLHTILV